MDNPNIIDVARQCLETEAKAITQLLPSINKDFEKAVDLILSCRGKLIVTGVGKSGHIGSKIAATLASTGTPSFYLNPLDAYHGDLGMIDEHDVVMAISYSGMTDELIRFMPMLKERKIPIIGMSCNPDSILGKNADIHLNIAVESEADPLNLVPTSSTTVTMVMGDALACALMVKRHFESGDFARLHPGGDLGRRLLTHVSEMMVSENLPIINPLDKMGEAIELITQRKLGLAIVVENNQLVGIITDGDVRRAMHRLKEQFFTTPASEVMCKTPKTIQANARIVDAGEVMNHHSIHSLIVMNERNQVVGVIDSFSCLPGTRFYH